MKINLLIALLAVTTISSAQYTKLFDFSGTADGANPYYGSLVSDGSFLYGMTAKGGANDMGVIFKIKPDGTGYSNMHDFAGYPTDGNKPLGSLISVGGFFYGMTNQGGTPNGSAGTIFKIKPDGTAYEIVMEFGSTVNAGGPLASLFYDGSYLYGTTSSGGTNNNGVIFKVKPDGTGYIKLLEFMGQSNGSNSHCTFISDGVYLYGTTDLGGSNGWGTIFKIKPDGTGYVKLLDFGGAAIGEYTFSSLIYDGAFLYSMTSGGGTGNGGIIFKIKTDGTGYADIHDFQWSPDGALPLGSLISFGGFLYGTTKYGGITDDGTIFKIKPDGTGYSKVLDFSNDTIHGYNPYGTLFSDGTCMYGMTYRGGANDSGTIFKINPAGMDIAENNEEKTFTLYPNPFSTQTTLQTDKVLQNASLTIYNSFGQAVRKMDNLSGQTFILTRDNLPSGFYFIRLTEGGRTLATDKLIITDN